MGYNRVPTVVFLNGKAQLRVGNGWYMSTIRTYREHDFDSISLDRFQQITAKVRSGVYLP